MDAVAVIRALLVANPQLTALVPEARIVAGTVPQDAAMPAIGITEVSAIPMGAIDAQAEFSLVSSRVQVSVMAHDYPSVKPIIRAVRRACNFQRGQIAGVDVASITRDTVGPDLEDDAGIHSQSIDFKVVFHEPN